jgi:endo-1,4-beta-xylanase
MVSMKSFLAVASAALTAMAMPHFANNTAAHQLPRRQTISTSSTGTVSGHFYSLWMASNTGATMDIEGSTYSLNWQTSSQNVVGGIGWNPGSTRFVIVLIWMSTLVDLMVSIHLGW